jgi:hypothetical protein
MIKKNESRIGNYILFKEWGEGDGKVGQMKSGDFGRFNTEEYHPIALTSEWLGARGFYQVADCWALDEPQLDVVFAKDRSVKYIRIHGRVFRPFKKIEYVHHLQNLYLDLTGEELTIKEKHESVR